MTNRVREKPTGSHGRALRRTHPQVLDCSVPNHQTQAGGRQDGPDHVETGDPSPGGVADEAARDEDEQHQHDLADEHHPPAQLGRGPTAEDRSDGDAGAGHLRPLAG